MTTKEIYDLAVKMGVKADLRGQNSVKKYLERTKKKYDKLSGEAKKEFDKEKLTNPYSDTRILVDNNKKEVKKIMVGIDMESPELLLAKQLGDIDLVIAHHPEGKALADLHSVMDLQSEVLSDYGVPINIAESVIKPRLSEVSRGTASSNLNRAVDMANFLKIDFACFHTVADNLGAMFLKKIIDKKNPEYVEDLVDVLKEIPEYKKSIEYKTGIKIFSGSGDNRCGKIAITEFTGGTSGSKDMYEKISQAGIGTIIGMHMSEDHRKEAEKNHLNVVIAAHMASDSLGMNLLLDEIEKKGIEIIPLSGLTRIKRFS